MTDRPTEHHTSDGSHFPEQSPSWHTRHSVMLFSCARGTLRTSHLAPLLRPLTLGRSTSLGLRSTSSAMAGVHDGGRQHATPAPVSLTKEYIRAAFELLSQTDDAENRSEFFRRYMVADVRWEITGSGHELAGTRNSLAEHSAASFSRLGTSFFRVQFHTQALPALHRGRH